MARSTARKTETVDEFMQRLKHPLKAEVEVLRGIIRSADPQIGEEIKWNAPSYFLSEHFATFNLHSQEYAMLVLHRGAKSIDNAAGPIAVNDPQGILEWIAQDRCAVKFRSMQDVTDRSVLLVDILRQWIQSL